MRPAATHQSFEAPFELDTAQQAAVELLTRSDPHGVYLWGPVGRGKTWLLDSYFAGVTSTAKKRVHFHSFFRDLHAAYFRQKFSIDRALDEIVGEVRLLCFDEFHVHDIGDGTLIARLLDALFARGVALVVTSNYPPDGLLPNPLFHDKFVPTIELLKKHVHQVHLDGCTDYRGGAGGSRSSSATSRFARGSWTVGSSTRGASFDELCDAPTSTGDYLAMAEKSADLVVTGIPQLTKTSADAVQRFCNLVDVLHDRDIRTDFHSQVPLERLTEGCTGLDIDRTRSRLSQLDSAGESGADQPETSETPTADGGRGRQQRRASHPAFAAGDGVDG